jgi:hypothetical protein
MGEYYFTVGYSYWDGRHDCNEMTPIRSERSELTASEALAKAHCPDGSLIALTPITRAQFDCFERERLAEEEADEARRQNPTLFDKVVGYSVRGILLFLTIVLFIYFSWFFWTIPCEQKSGCTLPIGILERKMNNRT